MESEHVHEPIHADVDGLSMLDLLSDVEKQRGEILIPDYDDPMYVTISQHTHYEWWGPVLCPQSETGYVPEPTSSLKKDLSVLFYGRRKCQGGKKMWIPDVSQVFLTTTYDTCQQNNQKDVPELFGVPDYRPSSLSEPRDVVSSPFCFDIVTSAYVWCCQIVIYTITMQERGCVYPCYWEHKFNQFELCVVESNCYWIKSLSIRVKIFYLLLPQLEISHVEVEDHHL